MSGGNHDNFRFSSGPIVTVAAALVVAALIGLVITVIATGGNGFAVGLLITVVAVAIVGFVLERIDSSRKREQGSEGTRDAHWGFHGRPGR